MTALDQAIIKAYLRQGGASSSDEVESNESACLNDAPPKVVCALQTEPARPRGHQFPGVQLPLPSVPLETLGFSSLAFLDEIAKAMECPGSAAVAAGQVNLPDANRFPRQERTPVASDVPLPRRAFEPMLRVDAISWPRPSRRLRQVAGRQIEHLADTIRKAAAAGGKVIGIAGYSCGEGCTTVLLAVALRLVELGEKTLLLDGDLVRPKLAEQLALANDLGWRDVAAGSVSLEEAVTQSDSESLALLPYCGQMTPVDGPAPSEESVSALLNRLRSHYDVLLVDLGAALTNGRAGGVLAEKLAARLDSVVAVHNVQSTSPSHLAMLRQHFRRLGIRERGIVENFVDEGVA
ncbi:MAG: hypothetical protein GXX96_00460 [Planctomycetaceae bacterium]|jgi:Mrp family chromosome partitioning ATPase|nr:hypothetical protein [Planctomycetaceae bacterium]